MPAKDTRTAILEAAISLMGRSGGEGFTASALAAEVGVSKATLFHHFTSLEEIPIAALDLLTDQALTFELPSDATLRDVLAAMGAASLALVEGQREFLNAYFTFFSKAMFEPRLKVKLLASLNLTKEKITSLVAGHMGDPARARELTDIASCSTARCCTRSCLTTEPNSPLFGGVRRT